MANTQESKKFTSPYQERIDNLLAASAKAQPPVNVVFSSEPGVGKTAMIESLADRFNTKVVKLTAGTMDPSDVQGMPFRVESDDENVKMTTNFATPVWAIEANEAAKENGVSFLLIDELSTATQQTFNAFLTLMQSRHTPNGYKLHENVMMIAAMNPANSGVSGTNRLSAAIANRLMHVEYTPPILDWVENLPTNWGNDESLSETERKNRTIIAEYIRANPARLQESLADPTVASRAQTGYGTRRSWENVARVTAGIDDTDLKTLMMTGLVGEQNARDFITWERGFRLPDAEKVLENPSGVAWTKDPIKQYAIMNHVVTYASSLSEKSEISKLSGVFQYVLDNDEIADDIATSLLSRTFRLLGAKAPSDLFAIPALAPALESMGMTPSRTNLDD